LNLPAGYFRAHTSREYVVPEVVSRSIEMGLELINALSGQKFLYNYMDKKDRVKFIPSLSEQIDITYLSTHDYGTKYIESVGSDFSSNIFGMNFEFQQKDFA
jgi:hypothetical protein